MAKRFAGFPRQMLTFLRGLEKNNRREWFLPRKELFERQVRGPMVELVTLLNGRMRDISVEHVAEEPAKLIYRIYRDTRFSKDKTPYKTHIGATFAHRTLPRHGGAGFYFEVSHRHVGIAGGVYGPGPEELATIRAAIAAKPKEFLARVAGTKLMGALRGEKLVRLPKEWKGEAGSAVEEYLKMKQWYWYVELPAELALSPRLVGVLVRHFEATAEAMKWFNGVLLAERKRLEGEAAPVRPEPMW